MSFNPPGEVNPFEAPRAGIGDKAHYTDLLDSDAEMIRREHIGREANIKSLGLLDYLGGVAFAIYTFFMISLAIGAIPSPPNAQFGVDPTSVKFIYGGIAFGLLLVTVLYGALGYGLTHLQNWARWTTVALTSLGLVGAAYQTVIAVMINPIAGLITGLFGGSINGFILWLMVSSKAKVVFSPEYKEIIRKTPHVKQKTSIIVKILLGLLVVLLLFIVLAAILSRGANR